MPIASPAVSLSLLAGPEDWPAEAWLPGLERRCATAVVGPEWPSSTLVLMLQLGEAVHLSVWDDSGLFDLDRFPAAVRRSRPRASTRWRRRRVDPPLRKPLEWAFPRVAPRAMIGDPRVPLAP